MGRSAFIEKRASELHLIFDFFHIPCFAEKRQLYLQVTEYLPTTGIPYGLSLRIHYKKFIFFWISPDNVVIFFLTRTLNNLSSLAEDF